jgi:hypothetical protein
MRLILPALLLISAPAFAQPAPPAPPAAPAAPATARERLIAADADKDGKWSKAEWLAAGRREQGFSFLDANADGFVTPDELTSGMAKLRAMGMATPQ